MYCTAEYVCVLTSPVLEELIEVNLCTLLQLAPLSLDLSPRVGGSFSFMHHGCVASFFVLYCYTACVTTIFTPDELNCTSN